MIGKLLVEEGTEGVKEWGKKKNTHPSAVIGEECEGMSAPEATSAPAPVALETSEGKADPAPANGL